jgi:hypothetical protein
MLTHLYSGSIDGWYSDDFHARCDDKGPTLTLLKTSKSNCVGGFTEASWSGPEKWEYKSDSKAVIFNLTTKVSFKIKD